MSGNEQADLNVPKYWPETHWASEDVYVDPEYRPASNTSATSGSLIGQQLPEGWVCYDFSSRPEPSGEASAEPEYLRTLFVSRGMGSFEPHMVMQAHIAPPSGIGHLVRSDDNLSRIKGELVVLASRLPSRLRSSVMANISRLLDALAEDAESEEIDVESLRNAFRFLAAARPAIAPTFTVTEDGYLYLQWFEKRHGIVGVIVKSAGQAVWSASQVDPIDRSRRMSDAGQRQVALLPRLMRELSPWAFPEYAGEPRRRTAT